jgi:hypothetical protein
MFHGVFVGNTENLSGAVKFIILDGKDAGCLQGAEQDVRPCVAIVR